MPSPTLAQLGAAIRKLREDRGLSIEKLADDVEMHRTYLSMIERGLANPTWKVLTRLADEFSIDIAELALEAKKMPRAG